MTKPLAYGAICNLNQRISPRVIKTVPVRTCNTKDEKIKLHALKLPNRAKYSFPYWKNVTLRSELSDAAANSDANINNQQKEPVHNSAASGKQRRRRYGKEKEHCPVAPTWFIEVNDGEIERYKGTEAKEMMDNSASFVVDVSGEGSLQIRRIHGFYNFVESKRYEYSPNEEVEQLWRNRVMTLRYMNQKYHLLGFSKKRNYKKKRKMSDGDFVFNFEKTSDSDETESIFNDNEDNYYNWYTSSSDESSEAEAFYYGKRTYNKLKATRLNRKTSQKRSAKLPTATSSLNTGSPTTSLDVAVASTSIDASSATTSTNLAVATTSGSTSIDAYLLSTSVGADSDSTSVDSDSESESTTVNSNLRSTLIDSDSGSTSFDSDLEAIWLEPTPSTAVTSESDEYDTTTRAVKYYLKMKPMTTVELIKKVVKSNTNTIPVDRIVPVMAEILKKLQPSIHYIHGKLYLSLEK